MKKQSDGTPSKPSAKGTTGFFLMTGGEEQPDLFSALETGFAAHAANSGQAGNSGSKAGSGSSAKKSSLPKKVRKKSSAASKAVSSASPEILKAGSWIRETLYQDFAQSFCPTACLASVRSPFQEITICETATFGRILLLDGAVQITEKDEFIYQEMIAHVPLFLHENPENILIIGAGDGGVLKRVLQHKTVKKAVMVEIDSEVVRLCREFLPEISGDAFDDPRTDLRTEDGVAFVKNAPDAAFDVIIVDSTDPVGVGEVLFTDEFYQNCARILTKKGLVITQSGVPFLQPEELKTTSLRRRKFFSCVTACLAAVPTYVGGHMALGLSLQDKSLLQISAETLQKRAQESGIFGKTRYWSPEVQLAAFALPPFICDLLPKD